MNAGSDVLAALMGRGYDFWTGVPCTYLRSLFSSFMDYPERYTPALREDSACAIAAGAYLGGRLPVVAMQNSGFAVASNAIASLLIPYHIRALLIVSWRGKEGVDSQEHDAMGAAFPRIVAALGLPLLAMDREVPAKVVDEASSVAANRGGAVVISVERDIL